MKTSETAVVSLFMIPFSLLGLAGSLAGPCFLVFLVLKLCKVIDWSWWWVCAPIIGVASALLLVLVFICLLGAFLGSITKF
jgi:hypothetical protein